MPKYVYCCMSCHKSFEKLQPYGDEPLTECPEENCHGILRRAISPFSFKFSGGKPSAEKKMHRGQPVHQTEEGHYEVDGLLDRR